MHDHATKTYAMLQHDERSPQKKATLTSNTGALKRSQHQKKPALTNINGTHLVKWLMAFCVLDCVGAVHVQPTASQMATSSDLQIELIVNEKPARSAVRFVAEEAPKYHIVAFDQRTQDFSHLVHDGDLSYRFTSTNGGYAPSGNETIGCAVESSRESAQETGGLPNGFTVSQLSQQARARLPSGTPPFTCMHTHGRGSASRDPWLAAFRRLPGHLGDGDEAAPER